MEYNIMKEVQFAVYCRTCKHWEKHGYETPCNECLESPMNAGTDRPVLWEEKK